MLVQRYFDLRAGASEYSLLKRSFGTCTRIVTRDMAEIKPMALIESMSKKVCEHSDVYFRTNKRTGKVYTGKLCNPSTKAPSAAQTAAKARFAKVTTAVRAILAGSTEQKTQLVAEYKSQTKYGSLFGYAMHKLNDQYDQNGDPIGG